jgi:hypothetical protein
MTHTIIFTALYTFAKLGHTAPAAEDEKPSPDSSVFKSSFKPDRVILS